MSSNKFWLVAVALFPLLGNAPVRGDQAVDPGTPPLSLSLIVGEVLSNNPSLKAARSNWEAMKERVPQARAWDDPRFGLDATAGRFVTVPPNSFTDYKYGLEQTVPLSGKPRLRGRVAEADAASSFADFHRQELDLVARARMAYFSLANAYEQLAVNRRSAALLQQLVAVTRSKYEVGNRTQSDVLSAETELGKLEEGRFDIERQIADAESQLNVLLNRSGRAPLGRPGPLDFKAPNFSLDTLHSMAREHRPEFVVARRKIDAARTRVEIARRDWIPEPSFKIEASQYNEAAQAVSEVAAGVSFNLPWFNRAKYSARTRETKKLLESAEQELAALETQTLGLVRDHVKKIETFHHHTELFRDKILPLARQNVTAARLGYETDKAALLNVIEAQRTLQDAESMYWTHFTEYLAATAELEAMIGTDPNQPAAAATHQHQEHHE